jgi:hypothetical protein
MCTRKFCVAGFADSLSASSSIFQSLKRWRCGTHNFRPERGRSECDAAMGSLPFNSRSLIRAHAAPQMQAAGTGGPDGAHSPLEAEVCLQHLLDAPTGQEFGAPHTLLAPRS